MLLSGHDRTTQGFSNTRRHCYRSELEGLRREKIPIDKFEEKVRKHLIVDLRKQGNVKPQIKP